MMGLTVKTGMKTSLLAAAAALSLTMAAPASAAIIYDNGGSNQSGGTEMSNTMLAQDFRLATQAALTNAVFHAVSLDDAITSNPLAVLQYAIFADNGGAPGSILASGEALDTTLMSTGSSLGGEEYRVSFNFQSAFTAAAQTTYWFGLRFGSSSDPLSIYWSTADFNDTALGQELFGDNWGGNTQEHTFSLGAGTSAVPEPATWAMMITGFALMGGAIRRRRVTVARAAG